jgi:predicted nuclease with TOPRIM domain
LGAGFDDENNSAHFSLKDSNLNFTDRVELSSARSSPQHPRELLQEELATQRKMYSELEQRHNTLLQKYGQLEAAHEETRQELASRDAENSKLRETLMMRKEL